MPRDGFWLPTLMSRPILGSVGKTTRDVVRNQERWEGAVPKILVLTGRPSTPPYANRPVRTPRGRRHLERRLHRPHTGLLRRLLRQHELGGAGRERRHAGALDRALARLVHGRRWCWRRRWCWCWCRCRCWRRRCRCRCRCRQHARGQGGVAEQRAVRELRAGDGPLATWSDSNPGPRCVENRKK